MDTQQHTPDDIEFNLPKNQSSVIKVLGVGGGGSNAVNYMYNQGIMGVDFIVTNTDAQHLENCAVPNKIQLGVSLTEGLGAGANPEIGEKAAQETLEELNKLLQTNTKMLFITAGMGGGTGTGAAPVIAKAAMDLGILTVGIVTMPFSFEGKARQQQAQDGMEKLRASVDALVVINNNKLREVYGNLGYKAGFAKADEVLATASRGIAEVITHHYTANIDLRDAKTVLANSGTAIMGSATANGENRATDAIANALDSPLLNDNHIHGAKHVLLLIVSGNEEITIDEIGEINEHIQREAGGGANIIMGIGDDEKLANEIGVTVIATGFTAEQEVQVIGAEPQKIVRTLYDEQPISKSVYERELKTDEEDDDAQINRAIAKAGRGKSESKPRQPRLFEEEEPTENAAPDSTEDTTPAYEKPLPPEKPTTPPSDNKEEEEPLFTVDFSESESETENKNDEANADENKARNDEAQSNNPYQARGEKREKQRESQVSEPSGKRYTLDDYKKLEDQFNASKPNHTPKPQSSREEDSRAKDEELKFTVREVKAGEQGNPHADKEANPLNTTIEESRQHKTQERRSALKAFNYRFRNQKGKLDEAEQEPAYKRQGVNLDEGNYSSEQRQSRYTIEDSNDDELQLKNNNRFLHDNVD